MSTSGDPGASGEGVAEARGRTAGWGPLNQWVLELRPPRETGEGSGSGNSSEPRWQERERSWCLGRRSQVTQSAGLPHWLMHVVAVTAVQEGPRQWG